jgi:NADPH-dependent 7-cyano-7-deazaguanine reductase QueF
MKTVRGTSIERRTNMMSEQTMATILTALAERINDLKLEVKVKGYRIADLEQQVRKLGGDPNARD